MGIAVLSSTLNTINVNSKYTAKMRQLSIHIEEDITLS